MKKSIAILSMALLACNAYAADKLEPGTVEAPNYYVITANRGLPFVTYTAEKKTDGKAETTIYRSDKLSKEAVWAVVAGQEDGTVNIYNYTTGNGAGKEYMFAFDNKNEDTEFVGDSNSGTATTTSEAADVYVKDNGNGSYGLALKNANGVVDGTLWALDATNNSQFIGNWQSISDGGTQWWFYAVDVDKDIDAELETIQTEAYREKMTPMVEEYTGKFQTYIDAVPYVEKELNEGIDALNQLEATADYAAKITDIWNEYISKANATLNTMFAGKYVVLNNIRKYNSNSACYLAEREDGSGYIGVKSFAENAVFTLESATDGDDAAYYLYNVATGKYFEADRTPVDSKEKACTIRFNLQIGYDGNNANGIVGLNIIANGVSAFNLDNSNPPILSYWNASGADSNGSIWAVVDVLDAAINSVKSALEPYIPNVPEEVAEVLTNAVQEAEKLEYSSELESKAKELADNAIAEGNALLETVINGKLYALKNLRRAGKNLNSFVAVNMTSDNYMPVSLMADFNAQFTLKSVENGGYQFYNDETKTYIGRKESETEKEGEDGKKETVTTQWFGPVEDAALAVTVYPVLNTNDGYYGISFPFAESKTGNGFNANSWADPDGGDLVEWGINDGGSIWQLVEVDVEGILNDAVNSVKTALEPYIPNVPEEVADVLKKAIQGTEYLEYNSSLASNASALVNNAIAAGNAILKNDLGGKTWALKSLRNGYIEVAKGDEKVTKVSDTGSDASTYSFVNDNEGGYRIYSPAAELYFGPIVDGDGGTDVTLVATEADAIKVYPVLNSHSGYYGVSFPTTDGGTDGINANASGLHGYTINDGGSIFSIAFVNVSTGIVEVEKAETVREGIYDLSGRKLSAPVRGINIINGHKVLVK